MAAFTTTYFEASRAWGQKAAERNAELMAEQSRLRRGARTPEFFFTRHFDNTRLVKAADPVRAHQMRIFSAAISVFLSLVMVYGVQHFKAIENGYTIESEKRQLEQLREENRQLSLAQAQLSQPGRIDSAARKMGLAEIQPGQVVPPTASTDASAPAVAKAVPPMPPAR